MRTHTITAMTAAAALTLFTAGAAVGQQHGHDKGQHAGDRGAKAHAGSHGMMGGMMGGDHGSAMHAAMAFGPGPMMLLHQKEALGLSDEQASRLDSIRAAMHGRMEAHHEAMGEIHGAMKELASSENPDMDRFRELVERMAEARVDLTVQMARTHRQAMDVLTPEQRSNARYGMKLMHRMMEGGHGQGGMMNGHPMMREQGKEMDREVHIRKRSHRDTTSTGGGDGAGGR